MPLVPIADSGQAKKGAKFASAAGGPAGSHPFAPLHYSTTNNQPFNIPANGDYGHPEKWRSCYLAATSGAMAEHRPRCSAGPGFRDTSESGEHCEAFRGARPVPGQPVVGRDAKTSRTLPTPLLKLS
jgi:hypothetical protein